MADMKIYSQLAHFKHTDKFGLLKNRNVIPVLA